MTARPPAPDLASIRAQRLYEYAVLAEHFHLTPDQIARMTPRQRREVYFHARSEEGKVIGPHAGPSSREPASFDEEMAAVNEALQFAMSLGAEAVAGKDDVIRRVKEKWGVKDG